MSSVSPLQLRKKRRRPAPATSRFDQTTLCNAVARLRCNGVEVNWYRPHERHDETSCMGSAFVYRIDYDERGRAVRWYLLTAYHIVSEADRIQGSFPSCGRDRITMRIVGACPRTDTAVLCVERDAFEVSGVDPSSIRTLDLIDSDATRVFEDVLVCGFPESSETVKVTKGIVSGREDTLFQVDAPVNPGNSGGPLLACCSDGQWRVIGIVVLRNSDADGIGFARPSAQIIDRLHKIEAGGIVRLPSLNVKFAPTTQTLLDSIGCPESGLLVRYVKPHTPLYKIMREGDVLVGIGEEGARPLSLGHNGEMSVPWWPEKLPMKAMIMRWSLGVHVRVRYWSHESGDIVESSVRLTMPKQFPIRRFYAEFEPPDYETFCGIIVMPLTHNHIEEDEDFSRRFSLLWQTLPMRVSSQLVVTFVCPEAAVADQNDFIEPCDLISSVNERSVRTMDEYRAALIDAVQNDGSVRLRTQDGMVTCITADEAMHEWPQLQARYNLPMSEVFSAVK